MSGLDIVIQKCPLTSSLEVWFSIHPVFRIVYKKIEFSFLFTTVAAARFSTEMCVIDVCKNAVETKLLSTIPK